MKRLKMNNGERIVRTWGRSTHERGDQGLPEGHREPSGIWTMVASVFVSRDFLKCVLRMNAFYALYAP